ncbi:extracellular solute-binding protein [Microvirga brassicacearum]|uniref:ABC transporter substrate-binding protein n=1 Tax=Microvirga brassicacearum TaxID=2580413 RepID=A0A5N3PD04_9HYPH|nr:extracellular solute-binding protein [Microvirga brassicacearum]KAB0267590.1 ABC transporter substrate-binding protein [Microvirga brassicacearum]
MSFPTRRGVIIGGAAASFVASRAGRALAQGSTGEVHGMSSFGDLKYGADFKHFDYVNPAAPKGGTLAIQLRQSIGNQNFDTFNTLNVFVLRGDGAAGIPATFDTLMVGSGDEPDAVYGLVAKSAEASEDRLTYRFRLRPEARFHDGSRLTAADVAFSLLVLKEKGHPIYRSILAQMAAAEAETEDLLVVRFSPERSRDLHLVIASIPIFSERYWQGRDFEAATLEAPLASGPYKVGRFEPGRFIELDRVPDYWARDLPVNVGQNNFDRIRYEYFRDRTVAFEAFKNGTLNFQEEYTSRIWATGYDFPALREGRVKKETIPNDSPAPIQGWYFNTRRDAFKDPRIREAIGLAFDFEWTNANIMYGSYKRLTSYFENTDMKAEGIPSPEELALLEPFRKTFPASVFGEPYTAPVSDGSGQDRRLLRRADELLREAGCKRDGSILKLPNGQPFTIEFLDFQSALQPHTQPFQANLKKLGIEARSRIVDAAQYQRRMDEYDFDMASRALSGAGTPGDSLRIVYGSQAAKTPGSRNIAGIADPAVDALVERIANAKTRQELVVACRALDRVLRAGLYWVPMWYKANDWLAYWDELDRPATKPELSSGAPATWWHDAVRAKQIGRG